MHSHTDTPKSNQQESKTIPATVQNNIVFIKALAKKVRFANSVSILRRH